MAGPSDLVADWALYRELQRGEGAPGDEARRALLDGRPWDALALARAWLARSPDSRGALVAWAEVATATALYDDACAAYERLTRAVPDRADVWLALAYAEDRAGRDPEASLRAAATRFPRGCADVARLELARRALRRGDVDLARREIESCSSVARDEPAARWLTARVQLAAGRPEAAANCVQGLAAEPLSLDACVVQARLEVDPAASERALTRALILAAPGALAVAARVVAPADARRYARLAPLVGHALGDLSERARAGDHAALVEQLDVAVRLSSRAALGEALAAARAGGQALPPETAALAAALALEGDDRARLVALDHAGESGWAVAERRRIVGRWCTPGALALDAFEVLLRDLFRAAEQEPPAARDAARPLVLAVAGEFNAGKSSFINAWLGRDEMRVGVLPTTSTVQRVVVGDVELVDTPGFNADLPDHAELAARAIAGADLVLWLFDASQPFKRSERQRLDEVARLGVPIWPLASKVDRLANDAERQAVLDLLDAELRELAVRRWCPPLAVSARRARSAGSGAERVEAGFGELRDRLAGQVLGRRAELVEQARVRSLVRALVQLHGQLDAPEARPLRVRASALLEALPAEWAGLAPRRTC